MLYGNYRFQIRFETEAELPPYKGSTIRGVFGHALKRTVCVLRHQECPACILRENCLYAQVFETPLSLPKRAVAPNGAIPHPFVIEPPLETKTSYQPGDTLECGLILFGEVNRMLPYFIHAFEEMGRIGIGRRGAGGKVGNYRLLGVTSGGRQLYETSNGRLQAEEATEDITLAPVHHGNAANSVRLNLETPLRFKREGRLSDGLTFDILVRLMLRRASSLLEAFDRHEPELDYRGLIARASTVSLGPCNVRWTDWERYSNRQRQRMQLGGLTGAISYHGHLDEFRPLLEFAKKTHIGKQTSFGLGKIGFELLE
ncbi:MAG: CRISPR system precrRNA processing endoribonuclease RAMP protein Cas6 [Desulfobacterales bacterium]